MKHKTQSVKRFYWRLFGLVCLIAALVAGWFYVAKPATGQGDDTYLPVVVPGIVTPDPTVEPLYIDMQHGQRMYVRCGIIPGEAQPAGQFTSPQFGVDVFILDCVEFGSTKVGE